MATEIRLNGEKQALPVPMSIRQLLEHFGLPKDRVAVERNRKIVPKADWESVSVSQGDELEVVHFVGGGSGSDDLVIAGKSFKSRLLIGTGKYPSHQVMREAHERFRRRYGDSSRPPHRSQGAERRVASGLTLTDRRSSSCRTRRPVTRWMKRCAPHGSAGKPGFPNG